MYRWALLMSLCLGSMALIEDALEVLKIGKEVGEEVLMSWDVIAKSTNTSGGVELPLKGRKDRLVLARLEIVARALERLEIVVEKGNWLAAAAARTRGGGILEDRLNEIGELISRINNADRNMKEYVRRQRELERRTLEDFASWCVSHDPASLSGSLERLHELVRPSHGHLLGRGVFDILIHDMEEHPYLCDMQLSQHQLIYEMYNTISLTEIKGYAMMQFSWMLLRIYDKGNFTQEASLTRQRYGERTVKTANAARNALAMAKRDLNRCDPVHHVEGETYAEVTLLLQGYIENEVDMNTEGTCKENCAYYTLAESRGCFKDMFCSKQRQCKGRILNCQYIDSDMTVCPSKKTDRRYDWIEYENGRNLGKTGTCSYATRKVDSWWKWNLLHCSYCFCLCEEEPQRSERFFSMLEALADESKNKVVTGLRLVKKDRVFHLQVSEGTLGPSGAVTPEGWVPVQTFDPEDDGRAAGVDYHMLTYERRAMDLDELDSPQGHILTGVRFRMIGSHLHFEIRSTPFNFTTGRLFPERSQWISNDNTEGADKPRSQLMLHRPDIPTRSRIPLPVDSKHDQYVEFTNSDLESDVAQSTVPFIDIQELMPTQGSSLVSGAGIIHRGAPGSGGFVAVKLFTYDYSRHVRAEPPPSSINEEADSVDFMPVIN